MRFSLCLDQINPSHHHKLDNKDANNLANHKMNRNNHKLVVLLINYFTLRRMMMMMFEGNGFVSGLPFISTLTSRRRKGLSMRRQI